MYGFLHLNSKHQYVNMNEIQDGWITKPNKSGNCRFEVVDKVGNTHVICMGNRTSCLFRARGIYGKDYNPTIR